MLGTLIPRQRRGRRETPGCVGSGFGSAATRRALRLGGAFASFGGGLWLGRRRRLGDRNIYTGILAGDIFTSGSRHRRINRSRRKNSAQVALFECADAIANDRRAFKFKIFL